MSPSPMPENIRCWLSAVFGALNACTLFCSFKSSGVLFIVFIREFQVDRETASWPLTFFDIVIAMACLLAGLLMRCFSTTSVMIAGSCLASIGNVLCYFATSLRDITLCLGILQGLGIGLVVSSVVVIINENFSKHRATALGISYTGSSVAGFVFPIAVEAAIGIYGLSGAFLIMAGITMQSIVFSSFLKSLQRSLKREKKYYLSAHADQVLRASCVIDGHCFAESSQVPTLICQNKNENNELMHSDKESLATLSNEITQNDEKNYHTTKPEIVTENSKEMDNLLVPDVINQVSNAQDASFVRTPIKRGTRRNSTLRTEWHSLRDCGLENMSFILSVLNNGSYYVLLAAALSINISCRWFLMIVVDFSMDKGVDERASVLMITIFSVADLIGRSGSGWVTDSGLVKRKNFIVICLTNLGCTCIALTFVNGVVWITILTIMLGLGVGTALPIMPVLITEYLGLSKLPLAMGFNNFIYGLITFSRPVLIGYYRDRVGSYDQLLRLIGGFVILSALLWFIEPALARWKRPRKG